MNQTPTPLVRIEGLIKTYGKTRALHGLSLDIAPGRIIGLVGENGCGKTTLMKILAGVLAEWQGRVEINGRAPGPETKAEIAFLPCADFLDTSLNAEKAIALYERFFADFDADKARRTIDYFGLPKDRTLKEMSRGMGQKLQIALVMARRVRLYVLTSRSPASTRRPATSSSKGSCATSTRTPRCSCPPTSSPTSSRSSTRSSCSRRAVFSSPETPTTCATSTACPSTSSSGRNTADVRHTLRPGIP